VTWRSRVGRMCPLRPYAERRTHYADDRNEVSGAEAQRP